MGSNYGSTSDPASGQSPTSATVRGKLNYLQELFAKLGVHTLTDSALFNWGAKGSLYVANAATGLTVLAPSAAGKFLRDNGAGADPSWEWGSLVQSVATELATAGTTTAVIPFDDTIPQNTEGLEITGLATTITPKYTDSRIEIVATIPVSRPGGTTPAIAAMYRDSLADAIGVGWFYGQSTTPEVDTITIVASMTSPGTSATIFKIRLGTPDGQTLTWNGSAGVRMFGGALKAHVRVKEYKA